MNRTGVVAFLGAIVLVAAACSPAGGDSADGPAPAPDESTTAPLESPAAGLPDGPSALDDPNAAAFPEPLVPVDEIISGGPPPDGIPSIDDPVFVPVAEAAERLERGMFA